MYPLRGTGGNQKCELTITVKDYQVFIIDAVPNDTLQRITDTSEVNFYLKSCEGKIYVEEWYMKNGVRGSIKSKGWYMESLDTLKQYVIFEDEYGNDERKVEPYFEPVRTGKWQYYTESENLYKEENYIKGVVSDN